MIGVSHYTIDEATNKMSHIVREEKSVKDGNDTVTYVWEVDESKPRIYIEGMGYKFNSTLIGVRRVSQRTRH